MPASALQVGAQPGGGQDVGQTGVGGARAADRAGGQQREPVGGGQGAVMAKEALLLQGRIPCAAVRLPLVRAEAGEVAALREALEASGLL